VDIIFPKGTLAQIHLLTLIDLNSLNKL